jgi:two-component system alkaline phosphatase synthesis response regulator PhoP
MDETRALILVVEDELHLAEGIQENLQAEGYRLDLALDGQSGLERIRSGGYDLVILDVMLPEIDGFTLCETIRGEGNQTAVLFLTARGSVDDRIRGLESGGDDYLQKPFHLKELLLRVRAILRRRQWYQVLPAAGSSVRFGGNEFDFRSFQGRSWDGAEQLLTHKEAMILKMLADREGEVVSREEILEKVWGYDLFPSTRTIDNFIVRLRKRFERDPEHPAHFHTVRGVGYRFTSSEGESSR